jgi:hypothetical protein
LTPEVKTKFTEKSKNDLREFCGHQVSAVVGKDGRKLVKAEGGSCHPEGNEEFCLLILLILLIFLSFFTSAWAGMVA